MVLWKFTLRELKNRPGRAILTLLSIVIGAAAVVAVHVSTATSQRANETMFENVTGRAALEVVPDGGGAFQQSVVESLRDVPGIEAVLPMVQQPASIPSQGRSVRLMAMGIEPDRTPEIYGYHLAGGQFFAEGGGGVLLEAGIARALKLHVGSEMPLLTRPVGGKVVQKLKVVGLLSPLGMGGFFQGGIVFLPLPRAQKYYARPGMINVASIVLADGADQAKVQAEIEQRLSTGVRVRTPAARTQLAQDTLQETRNALLFAYALILTTGMFVIVNTMFMNVGERRRQLAILRAIGATRGQVVRMILLEALALGVVGTVLGSVLGLGAAHLLTNAMSRLYSGTAPAVVVTAGPFLLAALLGPGLAVLAGYFPARMAGQITPLEGMRPATAEATHRVSVLAAIVGAIVFLISGGMMFACLKGWLPISWTIITGVIFTGAFVPLIPLLLGALSRIAMWILGPILDIEGRMAHRQTLRRPGRAGLTIGVLYISLGTALGLGTTISNTVRDVRHWQNVTMGADCFIRASAPDLSEGTSAAVPDALGEQIRAAEGLKSIETVRAINARCGDQQILVIIREFPANAPLRLDLKDGTPGEIREKLADGGVVVGTVLAHRKGLKVGDMISVETRKGKHEFPIAGTAGEYMVGGMAIYIQRGVAQKFFQVEGVDVFMIDVDPQRRDVVEANLKELADSNGLIFHDVAAVREGLGRVIRPIIGSLWGLVILGFVVAAFGIANTLTMNVLEQTRELALLRGVAMTRDQVRRTSVSQAMLLGLIGTLAGTVGGISASYITNWSMMAIMGRPIGFHFQYWLFGAGISGSLLMAILAALAPAERAARLNLLIALQYE